MFKWQCILQIRCRLHGMRHRLRRHTVVQSWAGAMGLNGPFLNPARAMEVTEKAASATPMLMRTLEAVKAIPLGGFEAFRAKAPPEMVAAIDVAKSRTEEIVNEVMRDLKNVLGPEIVGRLTRPSPMTTPIGCSPLRTRDYSSVESSGRLESGFHLFDGIHNVRQLTDSLQVVTDKYAFDAWGNTTSSTGSMANSQLWKGQYLACRKDPDAGPERLPLQAPFDPFLCRPALRRSSRSQKFAARTLTSTWK